MFSRLKRRKENRNIKKERIIGTRKYSSRYIFPCDLIHVILDITVDNFPNVSLIGRNPRVFPLRLTTTRFKAIASGFGLLHNIVFTKRPRKFLKKYFFRSKIKIKSGIFKRTQF